MRKSAWNYYGVKLIYQMIVTGRPIPERIDKAFSDTHTFFEESVMLVHAQSFDHAYTVAERKARENLEPYTNAYGQTVETKLIDAIDCFLIIPNNDGFTTGTELYSSISPVAKEITPREYLMRKYEHSLADHAKNGAYRQRSVEMQKTVTYEEFSKWRKTP